MQPLTAMIILLMGVTGSGKTTVGQKLAARLGWKYLDADDFHSAANVARMRRGVPLNDHDRQPWLDSLKHVIKENLNAGTPAVLACSALRQNYRDMLISDERVKLVYLKGDYRLIEKRLRERRYHYMNPDLLASQFEALEEPANALLIDVQSSPDTIVDIIRSHFAL